MNQSNIGFLPIHKWLCEILGSSEDQFFSNFPIVVVDDLLHLMTIKSPQIFDLYNNCISVVCFNFFDCF